MSTITRTFKSSFLADKSKLTRLLDVTQEKVGQTLPIVKKHFELHLSSGRTIETASFDEIFQVDNSKRNMVKRLVIGIAAGGKDDSPERVVRVDFDGRSPEASIDVAVNSRDASWAAEAMSVVEEQVERTLQSGVMNSLSNGRELVPLAGFASAVFLTVLTLFAVSPGRRSALADSMWLTQADLNELDRIQNDPSLKGSEVVSRQIKNIREYQLQRNERGITKFLNWRSAFIFTPIAVIFAALLYLVFTCYPSAVFPWGDAEDWYGSLVSRRKFIWSTTIAALVIGILGNLFVFALSSHG